MLLEPAGMISRFVFTQYNQATGVKSPKFPTVVVAMYRLSSLCNVTTRRVATFRQCPRHELRTSHNCFCSHCVAIRGKRPGGLTSLRVQGEEFFYDLGHSCNAFYRSTLWRRSSELFTCPDSHSSQLTTQFLMTKTLMIPKCKTHTAMKLIYYFI